MVQVSVAKQMCTIQVHHRASPLTDTPMGQGHDDRRGWHGRWLQWMRAIVFKEYFRSVNNSIEELVY